MFFFSSYVFIICHYDTSKLVTASTTPVNSSVALDAGGVPPKARDADDGEALADPNCLLPVAIELVVVQLVPSYCSVVATLPGEPPKANAAVCVPDPAKAYLAVPILLLAVQLDPLYSSVKADAPPGLA